MRPHNQREEGAGIRRRIEELNHMHSGKSRRKGLRINIPMLVPIILVFIIAFLFKQGI